MALSTATSRTASTAATTRIAFRSAIGAMAAASSCGLADRIRGQGDDQGERNQRRHNEECNDAAGRPAVEKPSFDPHVR